ncbi:MAG: hypothetical protein JNK49_14480 [Planctomycetes bacterium]|nr:hypothetical protein [Planctomycetota bacterium]
MTPTKQTLSAGSLLAPCGSLHGSAAAFAAAQALVLRPARLGGAWEPSSADLAFLREHGRHLRYLELPAEHAKELEGFDRLEHLVLTGTHGPERLDLAAMPQLRALGSTWSRGLVGFHALRRLRALSLHYCGLPDLSSLDVPLATLRSLTLKSCRVADLAGIGRGENLEFLHVSAAGRRVLPAAALQPLRRLRLLHVDGLPLPGLERVRLASTLTWLVLANVGELPSLQFLRAARPRLVSLRGRRTRVADGRLSSLLARRPAYVGIDRWHDDYDVAKEQLPKGDPRMPENRHRDPTGFAASS